MGSSHGVKLRELKGMLLKDCIHVIFMFAVYHNNYLPRVHYLYLVILQIHVFFNLVHVL